MKSTTKAIAKEIRNYALMIGASVAISTTLSWWGREHVNKDDFRKYNSTQTESNAKADSAISLQKPSLVESPSRSYLKLSLYDLVKNASNYNKKDIEVEGIFTKCEDLSRFFNIGEIEGYLNEGAANMRIYIKVNPRSEDYITLHKMATGLDLPATVKGILLYRQPGRTWHEPSGTRIDVHTISKCGVSVERQ